MPFSYVIVVIIVAFLAYVRLAPSDPSRWHVDLNVTENEILLGGAKRLVSGEITQFHQIALSDPQTRVLAGSVEEGKVTYVSRTKVIGFPDYTTVQTAPEGLMVFGRLRFGRSDFGVNAKRVDGWIAALSAA